jgi:hypothetical protein
MWKIGIVAAVTAAGALLLMPAASQAIPATDQLTCTFSGATSNMDDIPGIVFSEQLGGLGDAVDDPLEFLDGNTDGPNANGNGWIEHGSYVFDAPHPYFGPIPTECVRTDIDGNLGLDPDGKDDTGVYPASIRATGIYSNILCGTETTAGNLYIDLSNATGAGALAATESEIDRASALPYTIVFTSDDGPLFITSASPPNAVLGVAGNPNPPSRSASGAGEVHLEPHSYRSGIPCVTADATDFFMAGAVGITTTT